MTELFKAGNGLEVWVGSDGMVLAQCRTRSFDGAECTQALREFFQHERDQELGRWRDPELPHFYVINDEKGKPIVVDERSSRWTPAPRDLIEKFPDDFDAHRVAARYFAAHPEPKPWHDAKPGEAWVITYGGDEHAVISDGAYFLWEAGSEQEITDSRITAGRRIWPEVSDA